MKLQGKLTISRPTSSNGPDVINIRVQDNSSGIEFLDLTVSLSTFAEALTGLGFRPVEIEVYGLEYVGKKAERKQERVFVPQEKYGRPTPEAIREALAKHEVDGWLGSDYDASNYKNIVDQAATGATYSVGFTRYV